MADTPPRSHKGTSAIATEAAKARGVDGDLCRCRSVAGLKKACFRYRRENGHWAQEIRVTGIFIPALEDGATPLDVIDRVATTSGQIIWIHAEDESDRTACVANLPFVAILVHPAQSPEAPAEETTP